MPFNIADFSTHINRTGTLTVNRYLIDVIAPSWAQLRTDVQMNKLMQLRAEQVRLPGLNLETMNNQRYGLGPSQKFPTNVTFQDNNITFIDDANNSIWKFYSNWLNAIFRYRGNFNGFTGSYELAYKQDYARDMRIRIFNNVGNVITTIVMKDSYPIAVGDVDLGWGNNNQLFKVNVTFAYRDWYIDQRTPPFSFFSNPSSAASAIASLPTLSGGGLTVGQDGAAQGSAELTGPVVTRADVTQESLAPIPGSTQAAEFSGLAASQAALEQYYAPSGTREDGLPFGGGGTPERTPGGGYVIGINPR
jgi:hypothetical protein